MNQQAIHPRMWIFFAVLLVLTFLIGRSSAHSDSTDLEKTVSRIDTLSKRSEKRDAECSSYFQSLKAKTRDSEKKEYFASKASALAALSQAARYPGTPLATSQALELFLELYRFPEGRRLEDLRASLGRLSDCHSVEYYGVLTRLVDPRTRRLLTATQIDFERRLILAYLHQEAASGPKFFHQVDNMIDLLSFAGSQGLLSLSRETKMTLEALRVQKARLKAEQSGEPWDNLEDLSAQISMGEGLQEELLAVVENELESVDFPSMGLRTASLKVKGF